MSLVRGDEASLNGLLLGLEHLGDDGPLPDGTHSVESAVAMIKGMGGYGGPRDMAFRSAGERAGNRTRSPWFGFANLIRAHERYVAGDLEASMTALPIAAYNDNSFAMIRQFALAIMSMIARERGEER